MKSLIKLSFHLLLLLLLFACNKDDINISEEKIQFISFEFLQENNAKLLSKDINCAIEENSIKILIPHVLEDKNLIANFTFEGEKVFVGEQEQISGESINDFSKPVEYVIENASGEKKVYKVEVSAFTGLPIIFIQTENHADIVSKDEYLNATIQILGDSLSFEGNMRIKGRGNSTWGLPKKPYKLKFDKKESLLGYPKDKEWVLLANYTDKTNLRNETAFYLGRISELEWTPRSHFVEVFINDVYNGVYQLCEQIKISESRVNVTDNGYLLEVDQQNRLDPDDIFFTTDRILLNIKDPDIESNSEQFHFVKNYVTEAENALYSDIFTDPNNGYAKYLDVNSFVDWYLVNEITKNNDAIFFSSCYMNLIPGGKIKMGPIWDFDIALGNINYNSNQDPTGFWVKNSIWIQRLFEDPAFVQKVKDRFKYFKSKENEIYIYINNNANNLHYSIIENNNCWGTLYSQTSPNYAVWGSYENEIQYMKNWLNKRLIWLDQAFSQM